jgi:hypothetical protein
VAAGIDQQRFAGHRQYDRQRVGMRVASVQESMRPGVEDEMAAIRRARHHVSAVGNHTRWPSRRLVDAD